MKKELNKNEIIAEILSISKLYPGRDDEAIKVITEACKKNSLTYCKEKLETIKWQLSVPGDKKY